MVGSLTPREWEVIALVAQGLTNGMIAERLVIWVSTVESHVHSALEKLALSSRTQLTMHFDR